MTIKRKRKEMSRDLVYLRLAEGLIHDGTINPEGKSDDELQLEVSEHINRFVRDTSIGLEFIIDHKPTIIEQARAFAHSGQLEISCLFYAVWFEHWLNELIAVSLKRKKLTQQEVTQVLRDVQFRGKSTWLLRALGLKPINQVHLARMQNVIEVRNSYVHYKWTPYNANGSEDDKKVEAVKAILKTAARTTRRWKL